MNRLDADDLALAVQIQQKHAAGISAEKEETQLAKKVSIADRIGDEMDGQRLDVETVMIEMTALIVNPEGYEQAEGEELLQKVCGFNLESKTVAQAIKRQITKHEFAEGKPDRFLPAGSHGPESTDRARSENDIHPNPARADDEPTPESSPSQPTAGNGKTANQNRQPVGTYRPGTAIL